MLTTSAMNTSSTSESGTRPNRTAWLIGALMVIASVAAIVAKPTAKLADERVGPSLDHIVPKRFGDWREEPLRLMQVVNPQTQELLDKLYSEILTRVYINNEGYRIMLSLAYGSNQRGSLQAHKPEVCYPAHGFTIDMNQPVDLTPPF